MLLTRDRTGKDHEFRTENPDEDDAMLVARARLGDARAFAILYRRYVGRVYAFAARRLVDQTAAEEATQEVFTRALAGLGTFREDNAFAAWLFGTARNVVNEHRRMAGRSSPIEASLEERTDTDPTPEEHAVRNEAAAELRAARERCLTDTERELFDLLLADLTDREIAIAQGRRNGAVRTAHWRLLHKLRDCLGIGASPEGGRYVAS